MNARISDGSLMVTGFPRNLKQAEALHHSETMPDIVVDLQVPFEVIIDRISKRWIHEPSGRVYNLDFNKPKVPVCYLQQWSWACLNLPGASLDFFP